MSKNLFNHNVQLIPLNISNSTQDTFRMELMNIPYLLYEVEVLSTGEKIVINKPGGKRNFGRLAKNDFMVFIYSPTDEGLWLFSEGSVRRGGGMYDSHSFRKGFQKQLSLNTISFIHSQQIKHSVFPD